MTTPQLIGAASQAAGQIVSKSTALVASKAAANAVGTTALAVIKPLSNDVVSLSKNLMILKEARNTKIYQALLARYKGAIQSAYERLSKVKPSWLDRILDVKPKDGDIKAAIKYDLQNKQHSLRETFKPYTLNPTGPIMSPRAAKNPNAGYEKLVREASKPNAKIKMEIANPQPGMRTETFTTPNGSTIKYTFEHDKLSAKTVTSGNKKLTTYNDGPRVMSKSFSVKNGSDAFTVSEHYGNNAKRDVVTSLMENKKPQISYHRGIVPDIGSYDESIRSFNLKTCSEDVLASTRNGRYLDPTRVY